jgi:PhoD-like phosphatase
MSFLRVGPLVRAITPDSVIIWAECWQAGQVTIKVMPMEAGAAISMTVHTVTVGERHYVAPQLVGLQPATWYSYQLDSRSGEDSLVSTSEITPLQQVLLYQCFRTLDVLHEGEQRDAQPLLIAYGSCRNLREPGNDALSAFGSWLVEHFAEREKDWPRLLLLIGDQIYADEPSEDLLRCHPHLQKGAQTFADFADMYEYAWTCDERVQQVLAALPVYSIFDDHEIINNWNIVPTWRARVLKHGKEQLLVDGLAAYWVYQGWGNVHQRTATHHPLLQIMQRAAESGEDALEALRGAILPDIHGNTQLKWHYEIPTTPPIFVMDARADRPVDFDSPQPFTEKPSRIISQGQMERIVSWLYENHEELVIFVSSVPALLPPLIGWAEYVMGMRPWYNKVAPLHWLGRQLARIQYKLAIRTSFDHWPVFAETWKELGDALAQREQDVLVLSGDVHFSYAMEAHSTKKRSKGAHLYQLVSTPFENKLDKSSRKLVLAQARLKRARYGGLRMRMLPMYQGQQKRVPNDMLLRNVVAMVKIGQRGNRTWEIEQEYLCVGNEEMEIVGKTVIKEAGQRP